MQNQLTEVLKRPDIQKRAIVISLTAGTVLNCINQLPDLMDGESLQVAKLLLTYFVPYSVSLYSSCATILRQQSR